MARFPYRPKRGSTRLPESVRQVVETLPYDHIGVYILKDDQDRVLRIGYSTDLRYRIVSYFRARAIGWPSQVTSIEIRSVDSEEEAQALEKQLIDRHRPIHNNRHNPDKSTSGQQRDPETRQSQILNAAAQAFANKGYQRATIKEIARQAGIAPGTIYIYFEGKRDLLLSIADRIIGQAWSETQIELAALDKEAYIATVLENTFAFVRENQAFLQALIPEIWTDDDLKDQFFNQILSPLFETGAGYLEQQIGAGQARPCEVEIVIPALAGSLIMLPLFHILAPEQFLLGFSEDNLVDELTQLYLEGLKPSPEERAP